MLPERVPLAERVAVLLELVLPAVLRVTVVLLAEELPPLREALLLEELLVETLLPDERELETVERLLDPLERLLELELDEDIVPPTAREVELLLRVLTEDELLLDEAELRVDPDDDELRLTPEELLLEEDDDPERELVWLEEERPLPPLRDWALTTLGANAIAIAATAESVSL